MTIDEEIAKLERLRVENLAKVGADIMRSEVPIGETRMLYTSIEAHPISADTWSIGTDMPYAKYVENGRGEVWPKQYYVQSRKNGRWYPHVLRWSKGSELFFRPHAGPAKAQPFAEKTAKRLQDYINSIK